MFDARRQYLSSEEFWKKNYVGVIPRKQKRGKRTVIRMDAQTGHGMVYERKAIMTPISEVIDQEKKSPLKFFKTMYQRLDRGDKLGARAKSQYEYAKKEGEIHMPLKSKKFKPLSRGPPGRRIIQI